jgi:hypothetical protein
MESTVHIKRDIICCQKKSKTSERRRGLESDGSLLDIYLQYLLSVNRGENGKG